MLLVAPPDCHIWLRNVSAHVSYVCLFLACLFVVTFKHNGSPALRHAATNSKLVLIKRILLSSLSFFPQALFSFLPFYDSVGFCIVCETPTREKSQTIKEHWQRQVEQRTDRHVWRGSVFLAQDWNRSRQTGTSKWTLLIQKWPVLLLKCKKYFNFNWSVIPSSLCPCLWGWILSKSLYFTFNI